MKGFCLASLRLVLALVDFTVYPADATYVASCLEVVKALLTTSSDTCAHVQLPIQQTQTTDKAILKNQRKVEDTLSAASLDVLTKVTHMYDKSEVRGNDGRKTVQTALAVSFLSHEGNPWHGSKVFSTGVIGPSSLIPFNQTLGFDRDAGPPGAALRSEQILVLIIVQIGSTMSS